MCLRHFVWMNSSKLQLNPSKTEVLWCATSRRQHQLPATPVTTDSVPITTVLCVRELGIYIDGDQIFTCEHTFNGRFPAALLPSDNYVKFACSYVPDVGCCCDLFVLALDLTVFFSSKHNSIINSYLTAVIDCT